MDTPQHQAEHQAHVNQLNAMCRWGGWGNTGCAKPSLERDIYCEQHRAQVRGMRDRQAAARDRQNRRADARAERDRQYEAARALRIAAYLEALDYMTLAGDLSTERLQRLEAIRRVVHDGCDVERGGRLVVGPVY